MSNTEYLEVDSIFPDPLFMERYVSMQPHWSDYEVVFHTIVSDEDGETVFVLMTDNRGNVIERHSTFSTDQTVWLMETFTHDVQDQQINDLYEAFTQLCEVARDPELIADAYVTLPKDDRYGQMVFCKDVEELYNHTDRLYMLVVV